LRTTPPNRPAGSCIFSSHRHCGGIISLISGSILSITTRPWRVTLGINPAFYRFFSGPASELAVGIMDDGFIGFSDFLIT